MWFFFLLMVLNYLSFVAVVSVMWVMASSTAVNTSLHCCGDSTRHSRFNKSDSAGYQRLKGFYTLLGTMFMQLLFFNMWGLSPFISSLGSGMNYVQFLALWGWGSMMVSSVLLNFGYFLSNFMPSSPLFMMPFLSVMEVVSCIIRPLTLSLRLSINLTTGHILLWLLSNVLLFFFLSGSVFFGGIFVLSLGIFFYEVCMGVMQALVFSLLLNSYFGEHV